MPLKCEGVCTERGGGDPKWLIAFNDNRCSSHFPKQAVQGEGGRGPRDVEAVKQRDLNFST